MLAIDSIVGIVGDYAMTMLPDFSGAIAKDNYRLNKTKDDIIIVGSSRAHHHYVTSMLQDSIKYFTGKQYSVYNAGITSRFINSNICAAESIMDRYSPIVLIFEVCQGELKWETPIRDMETQAVNYHNNRFVKQYLDELGWKERFKMSSNMFRFNRKLPRIASQFMKEGDRNGYEPLSGVMDDIHTREIVIQNQFDDYSLRHFVSMLNTAKERNISLIIASSPSFRPNVNENAQIDSLCRHYSIPYFNLYDIPFFNSHPDFFKDSGHLNDVGAHYYTELFFEKLKPFLPSE